MSNRIVYKGRKGKKRGQKPKIGKREHESIMRLGDLGATLSEVAKIIGVCRKTLYTYLKKKKNGEEFERRRKAAMSDLAEKGLRRLLTGFKSKKSRKSIELGVEVSRIDETIQNPPNITAIMFLLTNLHPEIWSAIGSQKEQEKEQMGQVIEVSVTPDSIKGMIDGKAISNQ